LHNTTTSSANPKTVLILRRARRAAISSPLGEGAWKTLLRVARLGALGVLTLIPKSGSEVTDGG